MNRRWIALAAGALAASVGAAFAVATTRDASHAVSAPPAPPTDAQVRALLATKYAQAQRHDARVYCADSSSPQMCGNHWDRAGGDDAVPPEPPRIGQSRVDGGFRALRVCGTDGLGKPYRSDFLVSLYGGTPQPVLAVFWSDRTWSGLYAEGRQPAVAKHTSAAEDC